MKNQAKSGDMAVLEEKLVDERSFGIRVQNQSCYRRHVLDGGLGLTGCRTDFEAENITVFNFPDRIFLRVSSNVEINPVISPNRSNSFKNKPLRLGWVFLEQTRILSGIQFTTHFIYFLALLNTLHTVREMYQVG